MTRALCVTCLVVLWPGCSLALGYPTPSSERAACHDGVDDDLDGLVDCDDPDCEGQCTETSERACRNTRDDDRDGLSDAEDPGCWPLLRVVPPAQRCVAVGPSTWQARLVSGDFDVDPPIVQHVFDARGPHPAARVSSGQTLFSNAVIAGRLEGTAFGFVIDWDGACPTGSLRIGLARANTIDPRAGAPDGIFWLVGPGCRMQDGNAAALAQAGAGFQMFYGVMRGQRTDEHVQDGNLDGTVGFSVSTSIPTGLATFAVDEPFRFFVSVAGPSDAAFYVTDLTTSRPAYEPCPFTLPQFDTDSIAAMTTMQDGRICALVSRPDASGETHTLDAYVSVDGNTWAMTSGTVTDARALGGGALTRLRDGRLVGAIARIVQHPTGEEANDAILVSSTDCTSFSVREAMIMDALPPKVSPRGMGIAQIGDALHLTFTLRDPPSLIELAAPSFGAPFGPGDTEPVPTMAQLDDGLALGLHATTIGNDRVVLASTARGAAVLVRSPDDTAFRPLDAPVVPASGIEGAFDRGSIEALAMTIAAGPAGGVRLYVAYGNGPHGACPMCTYPSATTYVDLVP